MKRIVVVGTTGCGKSTLASQLASLLHLTFVELDALHWGQNWEEASGDVFRERVKLALLSDGWAVGGNYSKAIDIIWSQADTLVWLDYPLWLSQWRLLKRTIKRIITKEDLWGTGNRETWQMQFFSTDSLFYGQLNRTNVIAKPIPNDLNNQSTLTYMSSTSVGLMKPTAG